MDFEIDRRKLLKATGAGMATVTIATGATSAATDPENLPGEGDEENPWEIDSFEDLIAIEQNLDAYYVLTDDIEFPAEREAMDPLGSEIGGSEYYGGFTYFTGNLDGQGYEIRNFEIFGNPGGLFAGIGSGGVVENLNIMNIDVESSGAAGGLAGIFDGGTDGEVRNVSVTGNIDGQYGVGGLFGDMDSGTLADSSSSATVSGFGNLGGIVGNMYSGGSENTITRTYAEGNVTSSIEGYLVGGFVGRMQAGIVSLCFATGDVESANAEEGGADIGGFVGSLEGGSILRAYARGNVTGEGAETAGVGGFAGTVDSEPGILEEVYSTGTVSEGFNSGGLVGTEVSSEFLLSDQTFALGSHVLSGYWDEESSGLTNSDGGVGLTTSQMTGDDAPDNMDGFDFTNTWVAITGDEDAIIGFKPVVSPTEIQIQATQPTGPGYPVFGWQLGEDEKDCIDRRNLGRGQEDEECEFDRDIERGGSRRELDRQTGRGGDGEHIDSETSRRDRGRGSRRGNGR